MLQYIVQRLFQLIPVLFIMSLMVFLLMHLLPGDPAMLAVAGSGISSKEAVAKLREQMGLDEPLYIQYFRFLTGAIRGDLGISMRTRQPVSRVLMQHFPYTLQLALAGMAIAIVLGFTLGTLAAIWRHTWVDTAVMFLAVFGVSTPIFWSGLMLIFLFSFRLGWLPATGTSSWQALILPSFSLGLVGTGTIARLTRSGLIEVMSEDYIRTARAKGLTELRVISRHAMKNAMIPVVTVAGLQFGAMLSGGVITETVFSRPGIGRLIVDSILWKDFRVAQGAILLLAMIYTFANLLVDVSYAWLDPRINT